MNDELTRTAERQLSENIGEVGVTYWKAPADMSFDDWQRVGNTLQTIQGSINWWIGDWLNEGEQRWGEMYAQAVEVTGWEYQRLVKAKWVAANVQLLLRSNNLSWTHHYEVAKLSPREQSYWLARAEGESWNTRQLRDAIKHTKELETRVQKRIESNGNGQHSEPLPGDYDEPAEYMAALYSAEGGNGDIPDAPQDSFDQWQPPKPHVAHNSGNNEWYTPAEYIEAARAVLGNIDLDPASSDEANTVVGADEYWTKEQDGLARDWYGRVWMNPPYSGDLIGPFTEKLTDHVIEGDIDAALVLVNNATETGWFQGMLDYASAVCFISSRVKFWKPSGERGAPLQGQAILYFGPDVASFYQHYCEFGIVVVPYEAHNRGDNGRIS